MPSANLMISTPSPSCKPKAEVHQRRAKGRRISEL
jgi:hypothetical protein